MGEELVGHPPQIGLAAVTDDGAVELGQRSPRHLRPPTAASLVAADERERVAAPRVGERDAGVGGRAQAGRNAGDHLERDALFVQEQRFLSAAIEDERIALLDPRHDFALARLLDQQEADGVLVGVLARRSADVDALGMPRGQIEHPRWHGAVVDHHVGRLETALSAHGDQPLAPWPGADQVDERPHRPHILSRSRGSASRGRLFRAARRQS